MNTLEVAPDGRVGNQKAVSATWARVGHNVTIAASHCTVMIDRMRMTFNQRCPVCKTRSASTKITLDEPGDTRANAAINAFRQQHLHMPVLAP